MRNTNPYVLPSWRATSRALSSTRDKVDDGDDVCSVTNQDGLRVAPAQPAMLWVANYASVNFITVSSWGRSIWNGSQAERLEDGENETGNSGELRGHFEDQDEMTDEVVATVDCQEPMVPFCTTAYDLLIAQFRPSLEYKVQCYNPSWNETLPTGRRC